MSLLSLLPTGGEYCVLRAEIADRLLACGDGDAALLYLYLLRRGSTFEEDAAMRELNMTRDRFDRAVFTLTQFEIAQYPAQAAQERRKKKSPRYTAAEMARLRAEDHKFETVCQTAEKLFGRPLRESELRTLMTACDYLELPPEVIIDMMTDLHQEHGELNRRQMEETAYRWADLGIRTGDAALAYIAKKRAEKPLLEAMKQTLGRAGYTPTAREEHTVSNWIEQGFDSAALQLAIDRMRVSRGSFSWRYLVSILNNWHKKGLHTVEEINLAEPRSHSPALSGQKPTGSGDWEDYFAPAESANDWEKYFK